MIERRSELRVRIAVRVEVSGTDARCEGFSETVVATNQSRSGALLTNMQAEVRCGDLIAVNYGTSVAQFRVVWVLNGGPQEGMQVAIHNVANQDCPWEAALPLEKAVGR